MTSPTNATPFDIATLMANLEAQTDGYDALAVLAEDQLEALLAGRTDEIDLGPLLLRQDELVLALQRLERDRLEQLSPWATSADAPTSTTQTSNVTLQDLITEVPNHFSLEESEALVASAARLRASAEAVGELNQRNQRLLLSGARVLARWRAHLMRTIQPPAVYAANGDHQSSTAPRAFDQAA